MRLIHGRRSLSVSLRSFYSGAPARAKRAWDRAPYSWNMVNLFSFGFHVIDRAYVRTYASTDCTGGVGETLKRKGGVSQACLGKSTSLGTGHYLSPGGVGGFWAKHDEI